MRKLRSAVAHTKLQVADFGAGKVLSAYHMSQSSSTYAVYRHTFSIDTNCNLCALSLLYAANAAYSSGVNMTVGGADRFGQRRQCEWSANRLVERHGVCQT
jgi:hypothetical protein